MKNSVLRLLGVGLLPATCPGCGMGGNLFRAGVDVMASPAAWLGNKGGTQNSPNSDSWTTRNWGPQK